MLRGETATFVLIAGSDGERAVIASRDTADSFPDCQHAGQFHPLPPRIPNRTMGASRMKTKCSNCNGTGQYWPVGMPAGGPPPGPYRPCGCDGGFIDDGRPDYIEFDEYKALLRAVLLSPADDLSRLVLCDWLEEGRYDLERAELIRVQCELAKVGDQCIYGWSTESGIGNQQCDCRWHRLRRREGDLWNFGMPGTWVENTKPLLDCIQCIDRETISTGQSRDPILIYRRGFISEIRLPLAAFVGQMCMRCDGDRLVSAFGGRGGVSRQVPCHRCNGTGCIEGHAKALFEAHPIQSVIFTDQEPVDNKDGFWCWPFTVREFLRVNCAGGPLNERFPNPAAAVVAASRVAIAYGRSLANLDPISTLAGAAS